MSKEQLPEIKLELSLQDVVFESVARLERIQEQKKGEKLSSRFLNYMSNLNH